MARLYHDLGRSTRGDGSGLGWENQPVVTHVILRGRGNQESFPVEQSKRVWRDSGGGFGTL